MILCIYHIVVFLSSYFLKIFRHINPRCGMMGKNEQETSVDRKEFSEIRGRLGKSQREMAQLLAVSLKAVQSFEQGWRNIPTHAQRQALFLLAMKESKDGGKPCWEIQACPIELKEKCPAWEFQSGHLCWFISGTICKGEVQANWDSKMKICRECKVFHSMLDF